MIATNPSDDILDFLRFLRAAYAPDPEPRRAGAKSAEIGRFVELAGLPLPALYLGYLREFGGQDPDLKMGDDSDTRVKSLIEFYEKQVGQPDSEIPPHGVAIAIDGLSGQRSLIYPETVRHGTEPDVAISWWGDVEYLCAKSFRNYLYRQGFLRGRFRQGLPMRLFENDDKRFADAVRVATGLGFQPYWFTDDYQACLEQDGIGVLYIYRSPQLTCIEGRFVNDPGRDRAKSEFIQKMNLRDGLAN